MTGMANGSKMARNIIHSTGLWYGVHASTVLVRFETKDLNILDFRKSALQQTQLHKSNIFAL